MPSTRPKRAPLPLSSLLGAALLLTVGGPIAVAAQSVESPVIPRGAFLLEVGSSHSQAARFFDGEGGTRGFAAAFLESPLTPETLPALSSELDRLRALLEDENAGLSMGSLRGRFDATEQYTPLRIGWGATDRFTVGATVPFVRRQNSSTLRIDPEGGTVGQNPAHGPSSSQVNAFRSEAGAALAALETAVAGVCEAEGPESISCVEGLAARDRVSSFLGRLDAAWDEALLFPLAGSSSGSALINRWTMARTDLAAWGADAPEMLPLADRALPATVFASEFVQPVWGADGFPLESPDAIVELGDVRLHLAVGLLVGDELGAEAPVRVRSAVEFTVRLPTGAADSMGLVTPREPPQGYGGAGVRWISDLQLAGRFAVLAEVDWETFATREILLLGTDLSDPWSPDAARRAMDGAPGDRLRLRFTPRVAIVPGLFLGAGWEVDRSGGGRWSPVEGGAGIPEAVRADTHRQRVSGELRFAGWDAEVTPSLSFPVEVLARASWALSGGAGAPKDRRFEIGVRALRGAR